MHKVLYRFWGALLLMTSVVAGWMAMEHFALSKRTLHMVEAPLTYVVTPGMTLTEVVSQLSDQGILHRPWVLLWYARLHGKATQIKAGEYRLDAGTTPLQLLDMLVSGRVVQHALTLVEGWTFKEVLAAVRAHPHITQTLTGLQPEGIMDALGLGGIHPEGWFYPETYYFPSALNDRDFLRRAYSTMRKRLQLEWEGRASGLPYRKPYEALILASIIEKETGRHDERERIAGVFVQRLNKGMRLASDPTVIYGLGNAFDGDLRRRDLKEVTPYNTYRRSGLPPTPIAMPGGDAIRAALHPEFGDALFFVARGDGSHHFSATYREHLRAVTRYQLQRQQDRHGQRRTDD
ncbi:MAG: endolytic transglycosylase MltG [Gammaproteobacteria bacterium]